MVHLKVGLMDSLWNYLNEKFLYHLRQNKMIYKTLLKKISTFMLIILGMISLTSQFSCKKALEEQINSPSNSKSKLTRAASNMVSVNPYSVDNIQK